jgi:biopolymer transport protein ExbD
MLSHNIDEERPVTRAVPSFAAAEQPISELNTTPLIDVMLVLLIMFIITVPVATHKVPLDLPTAKPVPAEPLVHRLELDAAGRISLDGAPVALGQLRARLQAIPAGDDVTLRAEPTTPYGRYDEVLAEIRRAGVTRLGTVGNERFAAALD